MTERPFPPATDSGGGREWKLRTGGPQRLGPRRQRRQQRRGGAGLSGERVRRGEPPFLCPGPQCTPGPSCRSCVQQVLHTCTGFTNKDPALLKADHPFFCYENSALASLSFCLNHLVLTAEGSGRENESSLSSPPPPLPTAQLAVGAHCPGRLQ